MKETKLNLQSVLPRSSGLFPAIVKQNGLSELKMKYPLLLICLPNLKHDLNLSRQYKPLKQGLRDSKMYLNIYFSYLIAGYAQVSVVLPWGF